MLSAPPAAPPDPLLFSFLLLLVTSLCWHDLTTNQGSGRPNSLAHTAARAIRKWLFINSAVQLFAPICFLCFLITVHYHVLYTCTVYINAAAITASRLLMALPPAPFVSRHLFLPFFSSCPHYSILNYIIHPPTHLPSGPAHHQSTTININVLVVLIISVFLLYSVLDTKWIPVVLVPSYPLYYYVQCTQSATECGWVLGESDGGSIRVQEL